MCADGGLDDAIVTSRHLIRKCDAVQLVNAGYAHPVSQRGCSLPPSPVAAGCPSPACRILQWFEILVLVPSCVNGRTHAHCLMDATRAKCYTTIHTRWARGRTSNPAGGLPTGSCLSGLAGSPAPVSEDTADC
jgi:hypothetical protein